MSEFASGFKFETIADINRQRIEMALDGKLVCGENAKGDFKYAGASPVECKEFILGAYDEVVHQAIQSFAVSSILNQLYEEKTGEPVDPKRFFELLSSYDKSTNGDVKGL